MTNILWNNQLDSLTKNQLNNLITLKINSWLLISEAGKLHFLSEKEKEAFMDRLKQNENELALYTWERYLSPFYILKEYLPTLKFSYKDLTQKEFNAFKQLNKMQRDELTNLKKELNLILEHVSQEKLDDLSNIKRDELLNKIKQINKKLSIYGAIRFLNDANEVKIK